MYMVEMEECRRRIALAQSLYTLTNHNPDFRAVITQGYLHDATLAHALNINADKSGTIEFLKAAAAFKKYLDKIAAEGEQGQIDLRNYQELLTQDAR